MFSVLTLAAGLAAAQPQPLKDHPSCKDHALFTRMPGYFMPVDSYCKQVQFDARAFIVQKGTGTEQRQVEGRHFEFCYDFDLSSGQTPPSSLQIQRNFQNAALKAGGKVLFTEKEGYYKTTLVFAKDGRETWAEISTSGNKLAQRYYLKMVEREAMKQDIAADAETMKGGLADAGHVEVPGIFFDFNQAEIKPDSKAALAEITKLLQSSSGLRLWVVGHTDNVGRPEVNLKLSQDRANAVVAALVQAGVDPKRVAPFGNGPYAPVASNTTEEGRARNRRVELVALP